jgi:hypothetical protein
MHLVSLQFLTFLLVVHTKELQKALPCPLLPDREFAARLVVHMKEFHMIFKHHLTFNLFPLDLPWFVIQEMLAQDQHQDVLH